MKEILLLHSEEAAIVILTDPFFLALYGWVIYNYLMFSMAKDDSEKERKKMSAKKYFNLNLNNWILSLLFVIPTALFAPEITQFLASQFGKTVEFYTWFYLGTGVLTEITIVFVKWAVKKIKRFSNA